MRVEDGADLKAWGVREGFAFAVPGVPDLVVCHTPHEVILLPLNSAQQQELQKDKLVLCPVLCLRWPDGEVQHHTHPVALALDA